MLVKCGKSVHLYRVQVVPADIGSESYYQGLRFLAQLGQGDVSQLMQYTDDRMFLGIEGGLRGVAIAAQLSGDGHEIHAGMAEGWRVKKYLNFLGGLHHLLRKDPAVEVVVCNTYGLPQYEASKRFARRLGYQPREGTDKLYLNVTI